MVTVQVELTVSSRIQLASILRLRPFLFSFQISYSNVLETEDGRMYKICLQSTEGGRENGVVEGRSHQFILHSE